MKPSDFIRKRMIIEHQPGQSYQWRKKALHALVRQVGAVIVFMGDKSMGYRLPSGQVVCHRQRFQNEAKADQALAQIDLTEGTHNKPARCYPCPYCHGWHLAPARAELKVME